MQFPACAAPWAAQARDLDARNKPVPTHGGDVLKQNTENATANHSSHSHYCGHLCEGLLQLRCEGAYRAFFQFDWHEVVAEETVEAG